MYKSYWKHICHDNHDVAIVENAQTYTYADVYGHISQLQASMASHLVGCDRAVVAISGGFEFTVAVLTLNSLGITYIPVDPDFSADLIDKIKSESLYPVIDRHTLQTLMNHETNPQTGPLDKTSAEFDYYNIFTSGSTGTAKLVQVPASAYTNTLEWYTSLLGLQPDNHFLIISSIGFDLTQKNLFLALASRSTLVFTDIKSIGQNELLSVMANYRIRTVNCTPTTIRLLSDNRSDTNHTLRNIILGGEKLLSAHVEQIRRFAPQAAIYNSYGPAECADVVSFHKVREDDLHGDHIPIGQPIPGVDFDILTLEDSELESRTGELCIGGLNVGTGYADTSLNGSFTVSADGDRRYATGDLVIEASGQFYCLGRLDSQVKMNGIMSDLNVLESAVQSKCGVEMVVAMYLEDEGVLALAAQTDQSVSELDIRRQLQEQVPSRLVPSRILLLDVLPMSKNQKVDRQKLKELFRQPTANSASNLDGSSETSEMTLRQLISMIAELAPGASLNALSDMRTLSLNSVQMIQLLNRINAHWNVNLTPRLLVNLQHLKQLQQLIDSRLSEETEEVDFLI